MKSLKKEPDEMAVFLHFIGFSIGVKVSSYGCTNVPMFSPLITFFKLPTVSMSNTIIGSLFSLHMQVAVKSITFKPRLNTSS
jgi:hypothetical protein